MGAVGAVVTKSHDSWHGMELEAHIDRACGRGIVGIAMLVAVETKRVTHVVHGNLKRSVHAAPVGYSDEEADTRAAEGGTDLMLSGEIPEATHTPLGAAVEVGSWLAYACVEWVGRQHPGITQGLEAARGHRADAIMLQAFAEEGLA